MWSYVVLLHVGHTRASTDTLSLAGMDDMAREMLRGPAGSSVPHGLVQRAALRTCGMLEI